MASVVSDTDLDLLLLIRAFEEALLDLFASGEVSGTTHTCLGQEYVPVALEPMLRDDFVLGNHRSHGHYLARFGDPAPLLAEILGRAGAPCAGVGGSQHILRDGFVTTGIQGQGVAVATGMALHYQRTGHRRIAAAYIGDGTWGEGVVYEALNMAQLWQLPLLVVVENNGIAQSTPTTRQMAGSVASRAAAFGVEYTRLATTDIGDIRRRLSPMIDAIRSAPHPLVVEFDTVRLGPHSKGDDTRDAHQLALARQRDWLAALRATDPERVDAARARQRARVARVVEAVRARPLSEWRSPDAPA
jgi:pyruvate dehydrogenase E1 component alpha subunit